MSIPSLQLAVLSSAKDQLVLFLSEAVTGSTPPVLTMSGGAVTAAYSQGSGLRYLVFDLSRVIDGLETGTLAITTADYASVSTEDAFVDVAGFEVLQSFDVTGTGDGNGEVSFHVVQEIFDKLFDNLFDVESVGLISPTQRPFLAVSPTASFTTDDAVAVVTTDGVWVNQQDTLTYQWFRGNVEPINTVPPVLSGATGAEGAGEIADILTVTTGIWSALDSITYFYQWFRNGKRIVGEVLNTYSIMVEDAGTDIHVEVTAATVTSESYFAITPVNVSV